MHPTLPTDSYVAAALEELATDTRNLLQAAREQKPRDKEEIAYWQRQYNAFNKAQFQWLSGVRPLPTQGGWLIPSASEPGSQIHRAIQHGGVWVCSCKAGELNQFHWHSALIVAIERGSELEALAADAAELNVPDEEAALAADILDDAAQERAAQILDETEARLGWRLTRARAALLDVEAAA